MNVGGNTSWIKGSNKEKSQGLIDAAFWYYQYQMHAYWLLEEIDGQEFY
jgi:hypothetical protein